MTNGHFYGPDGGHRAVFQALLAFFAVISCIASVINIVIITKMEKYTGHVLIVLSMTTCQLIYDVSFYPGVVSLPSSDSWLVVTANILQLIGGLGSSLYSNYMSFVVLYVIRQRTLFDVIYYFKSFTVFCAVFIVVEITLYSIGTAPKHGHLKDVALEGIYYYFRIISIFFKLII